MTVGELKEWLALCQDTDCVIVMADGERDLDRVFDVERVRRVVEADETILVVNP